MALDSAPFNVDPLNDGDIVAQPSSVRDDDIFKEIVSILDGLNIFDGVHYPCLPEDQGQPAAETKMAIVEPMDWSEPVEEFDDGGTAVRRARYRLTLSVRDEDEQVAARALDLLYTKSANALNGQSLLGATFPDTTNLSRGTWSKRTAPESKMVCQGEFQYLITGFTGYDTTE